MAWSSTVPAALAAILESFQSAPSLEGAEVRDGPVVTGSDAKQVVVVGWYAQSSDSLAAEGTVTMEGLPASPDREQYVIRCAALVLDGGGDMAAARAGAYGLAAACGAVIAANRTLGGLVLRAGVATQSLRQDQVQQGARATVEFGVGVDAYTGS